MNHLVGIDDHSGRDDAIHLLRVQAQGLLEGGETAFLVVHVWVLEAMLFHARSVPSQQLFPL